MPFAPRGYRRYTGALGVEAVERFRSGFGPFGTPKSAFLTGEVAMVVQGPWMANQVVALAPDLDYGVAADFDGNVLRQKRDAFSACHFEQQAFRS